MRFSNPAILAVTASVLVGITACDDPPDPRGFSPLGTDAELYGEWDVNSLVPSAEVCDRAGIDTIELVFSNADDTESFTSPELRFVCATGYFDSPGPMLSAGTFGYRWRAYSGETVVLESRRYSTVVSSGVELVAMPVDFVRRIDVAVNASLSWAGDTGFTTCASAFVETMTWELRSGSATGPLIAGTSGPIACSDGFTIPDLPTGSLEPGPHVLLLAGSASDGSTWANECALTVYESGPSTASCAVARAP